MRTACRSCRARIDREPGSGTMPAWWSEASEADRDYLRNFGAAPPDDFCSAACAVKFSEQMAW